jgi:hypothetical protein
MSNDGTAKLLLPLDERNLAHVFSAVALAALASQSTEACLSDTCWWCEEGFSLATRVSRSSLLETADEFVRSLRWIPGFGPTEHGTFATSDEIGSNPFAPLVDNRQRKSSSRQKTRSPFKAFSGQVGPDTLLSQQQRILQSPAASAGWVAQLSVGVGSWGFDYRVGSHAYDQGYSSNDEGSGDLDPVYPAVELLSIAGASFFCAAHGWQFDDSTVRYCVWMEPIVLSLVPHAAAGQLAGLPSRRYSVSNRAAAYGKGAAYRFFPEAKIESPERKVYDDATTRK